MVGLRQGATMAKCVLVLGMLAIIILHTGTIALRTPKFLDAGSITEERHLFFIGSYSNEIVLGTLQGSTLTKVASYPSGENPSFLALHPHKPVLYAVNEVDRGALEAFNIDSETGALSPATERTSSRGSSPAAISLDPSAKWLLFANYNDGSYGTVAIDPTSGALKGVPASFIKVHHLKRLRPGMNHTRQEAPHPHQLITDTSGKFVFACDLGTDEIHVRKLMHKSGALKPNKFEHEVEVRPSGSGPRHLIFTKDARFAYVINELASTVHQYSYEVTMGTLKFIASWSTIDDTVVNKDASCAAELALSPDEQFLYASNRGNAQDSIAVFSVISETGKLNLLGVDHVGGSGPRHFAFDPSGEMVIVPLQFSNSVSLMQRNATSGRLSVVGQLPDVKAPTYVQFFKR